MKHTVIIIVFELLLLLFLIITRLFESPVQDYLYGNKGLQPLYNYLYFLLVVDLIRRIFKLVYSPSVDASRRLRANFKFGIDNIARLLLGLGLLVTLFALNGIGITTLLTSLSIVAAAIAIVMKEYINDFLVGLYFSFSKNFEIGDYVKIGEHRGKISEIEMLKIKILNDDDDLVIIPNTKVYANEIVNYTKRDIRRMSIDFEIDLAFVQDIETFESELIESLKDFTDFISENSYRLRIIEVKKDYLELKFQYTLKQLDYDLQKRIRSKTVRQVLNHISRVVSRSEN